MKALINPPLNLLFTVAGVTFIGLSAYMIVNLKLMKEEEKFADKNTKIEIPSSKALAVPPLRNYKQILDKPLFWAGREVYVPPPPTPKKKPDGRTNQKAEKAPIDKKLPDGRLTGIINTGDAMMAVFKGPEESKYLYVDDKLGNWKIKSIKPDAIELALGSEVQKVDLISDFSAPAASKQAIKQARQTARRVAKQRKTTVSESLRRQLPDNVKNLPHLEDLKKLAPPAAMPAQMSIKEALAARQKLMAARWKKKK